MDAMRSKKVFFISECLVNQNIRAYGVGNMKGEGPVAELMNFLTNNGIGLSIVPCPEIAYEGLKRQACGKACYDNVPYRIICKSLAAEVIDRYKLYLDDDYKVGGFICVNGSPSCAIDFCYCDNKGTEKCKGPGVFIEELEKKLAEENLTLQFLGFRANEMENLLKRLDEIVRGWCD